MTMWNCLTKMKSLSININLELFYEQDYCCGMEISRPQYNNMPFYDEYPIYYYALQTNTWVIDTFDDYFLWLTDLYLERTK